jgi:2-iminobutanoate/2-iminopropanoate deaminase
MQPIHSDFAPKAIGPYSQAVLKNGLFFISGQLGIDAATGALETGFEAQARRVFSNLKAILDAAGLSFADVVKVTVFLQDLNDFAALNELYAQYFHAPYPAREAVQVARLPKDAAVEISLIACPAD